MPEFLSQEQVVKWQADRIAAAESKKTAAREQAAIQFYTGKPFDSSSESYLFKSRSYDPEFSRWTSADPSGFPDGANGSVYLGSSPVSHLDYGGLFSLSVSSASPDEASNPVDNSQKVWAFPLIHINAGSSHAGSMAGLAKINTSITTAVATTNLPGSVTVQTYQATPYGRGNNMAVGGVPWK